MAAREKRTARRRASKRTSRSRSRAQDAIGMLRADHERVSEMFARFQRISGRERKEKLVDEICTELETHTTLEEELFYPEVRQAIHEPDLLDEARVEHETAKHLIGQLRSMNAEDDLYDARVTVLGEYVRHHVKEEQGEMFPKVRRSGVDLRELGARMRERRDALQSRGAVGLLRRVLS